LRTPDIGDDSKEAKAIRKEPERFAVAALAFCLRHDEGFRKHFWEKVCRVPDDPEMPLITADDIGVEPPRWADLSLTSHNRRFKWVIEVKAGALLEPKQDPTKREFEMEGDGYGALFRKAEANLSTRMRYIVLGANPPPEIPVGLKKLGISVQQRKWADLLKDIKRKGIVKDLIDTFAELRIGEFYMEKAKAIIVDSGLSGVGKAYQVLEAVCEQLDIRWTCRLFGAEAKDEEEVAGDVGIYLRNKGRPSKMHLKLQNVTRKDRWCLGWFGYTYDPKDRVTRQVEFYLNDKGPQKVLQRRLKSKFPKARLEQWPDGQGRDEYAVIVTSCSGRSPKDFDWFESVFRQAVRSPG